jgi:hypothetical protein
MKYKNHAVNVFSLSQTGSAGNPYDDYADRTLSAGRLLPIWPEFGQTHPVPDSDWVWASS